MHFFFLSFLVYFFLNIFFSKLNLSNDGTIDYVYAAEMLLKMKVTAAIVAAAVVSAVAVTAILLLLVTMFFTQLTITLMDLLFCLFFFFFRAEGWKWRREERGWLTRYIFTACIHPPHHHHHHHQPNVSVKTLITIQRHIRSTDNH